MSIKVYLLAIFTVWALSFIPGFPGFALAEDVKELRSELKTAHVASLEWSLFDLRVKQCTPDIGPALKQAYGERIQGLLRSYHNLTGQGYHLASCEDLR